MTRRRSFNAQTLSQFETSVKKAEHKNVVNA